MGPCTSILYITHTHIMHVNKQKGYHLIITCIPHSSSPATYYSPARNLPSAARLSYHRHHDTCNHFKSVLFSRDEASQGRDDVYMCAPFSSHCVEMIIIFPATNGARRDHVLLLAIETLFSHYKASNYVDGVPPPQSKSTASLNGLCSVHFVE